MSDTVLATAEVGARGHRVRKFGTKARMALLGTAAAALSLGAAPGVANAQPDVTPMDASGCSVYMCMYTSGYPSGFHAQATSNIPAGSKNYGHFEFWGPGGAHWNSPDRYNPAATWNASIPTGGQVCGRLWLKSGPADPNWTSFGTVCHNVY